MDKIMIANSAAIEAERRHRTSSFSIFTLIEEAAHKYQLDEKIIYIQFAKLFPEHESNLIIAGAI